MTGDGPDEANLIFLLRGMLVDKVEAIGGDIVLVLLAFFEVPPRKSFRFRSLMHGLSLSRKIELLRKACGDEPPGELRELLRGLDDLRVYHNYVTHSQLDRTSSIIDRLTRPDEGEASQPDAVTNPVLHFVWQRPNGRTVRRPTSASEVMQKLELAVDVSQNLFLLADSVAQSSQREVDSQYFIERIENPPVDERGALAVSRQLLDMIMTVGPVPPQYDGPLAEDFDSEYY